jgi:hypothetical protein
MLNIRNRLIPTLLSLLAVLIFIPPETHAATIAGSSTLLTQSYANQLEAWIGGGHWTFTKIYEKRPGDTAYHFHSAVDGKGPTISVMQATLNSNTKVIGGYNPTSWDSNYGYISVPNPADNKAFIFNLTNNAILGQILIMLIMVRFKPSIIRVTVQLLEEGMIFGLIII